jgi:transglycosylase associated protein
MVPALCGSMTRVELMRAAAVNRFVVLLIVALAIPMAALAKNAKDIQKDEQQLHADARQLNADAARAASAPDGQRRLGERLAKQFNVDQSIVTDLRNRHFSYAQATITLALSRAVVGGGLFSVAGMGGVTGLNVYSLIVAVVGAVVFLVAYHAIRRRSS